MAGGLKVGLTLDQFITIKDFLAQQPGMVTKRDNQK